MIWYYHHKILTIYLILVFFITHCNLKYYNLFNLYIIYYITYIKGYKRKILLKLNY